MDSKAAATNLRLRRWIGTAGVLLGIGVVAFGISLMPRIGAAQDEAPGTTRVEIWSWNVAAEALQSLVPAFEQQHPDVRIKIADTGADVESRFLLSLAGGVGAPDVQQLQERESPHFIITGRLWDMSAYASKYADKFAPSFWNSCVHEGKVYAIPWDTGPCGIYYKRWLFKQYDVDPDAINTWDDFIDAGRKIKERSGGKVRMMPLAVSSIMDQFEIMMQLSGGGIFDKDGRIILASPQNVEALQTVRKIFDSGISANVAGWSPEYWGAMHGNDVVCFPSAVWLIKQVKTNSDPQHAGDWGVLRMPAVHPGGRRVANLGGSVLVVPDQSRHKDQAWQFLQFTNCTVAGQIQQYRVSALFPAFLPALKDPIFDEPDPFFGGQKVNRLFATDMDQIPVIYRTTDWNEATRFLGQVFSSWASDHLDTKKFLRDTANTLGRKLNRPVAQFDELAAAAGATR